MLELSLPSELHYFVEHQVWAREEPNAHGALVTVGITALGIRLSGEIYMCRPQSVGSVIEQGRSIAVVELAKSIVSVKSPVSGEVIAVNPALEGQPELVHRDPYGRGWLARLRPSDFAKDLALLLTGAAALPAMLEHARLNRVE